MHKTRVRVTLVAALVTPLLFVLPTLASASTIWNVPAAGACTVADPNCATIQAAINAASSGDTITVAPGTYNESPDINKSVTLQSSGGKDVTTIVLQTGPTYLGSLTIDASNVTVSGFTIQGSDAVGSGLASTNILLNPGVSNVTVSNNKIEVGQVGAGTNGDDGIGFLTTYTTTNISDNISLTGNTFQPVGAAGAYRAFYINPGVNHFTFSGNTITGNFAHTSITQAENGLVQDNTLTGTGAAGSRSAGLGTWGYPDPTVWGHTTFSGNTISGTAKAIAVFETNNVILTKNVLSGNETGIWVGDSTPLAFDPTTISAHNNDVSNEDTPNGFGVDNTTASAGAVNATCNWWGAANGPGTVGPGSGSPVSTNVNASTWLTSSDLTSACNGPLPATVTVTLDKFIDGKMATAASANSASFPMASSWNATNLGSGSGTFTLGPSGFNSSNPYEAVTSDMTSGASYSASEDTTGTTVGAQCGTTPYALVGYTTGDTLAAAAAATPTPTPPSLTGITSNKFIIVWNKTCPQYVHVTIAKYVGGVHATATNAANASFPMQATYNVTAENLGPIAGSDPYTLDPAGSNTATPYEARTLNFVKGGVYSTFEHSDTSVVGATCADGKPFAIVGYTTGDTLADAQSAGTPNPTSPNFDNLQKDEYVIVWNKTCPTTGSITVTKSSIGGNGTFHFTSNIPGHANFDITTVNNTGSVTFDTIAPGTYHVTEVNQPAGWTQTDTSCDDVPLVAGQIGNCVVTDTINTKLGSIRGTKFEDWDGDGSPYETRWEVPVAGVKIFIDKNGNHALDTNEVSMVTNKQGLYDFTGLAAGTYSICEVSPSGWTETYPTTNSGCWSVMLAAGQNAKKKDFGNFEFGSISGMKYNDLNGDGKKEANEPGLQGWIIKLKGNNGVVQQTVTDAQGNYSFANLPAGNYNLSEVMQNGWKQTDKPNGTIKVRSGTTATKEDFGNIQQKNSNNGHNNDH